MLFCFEISSRKKEKFHDYLLLFKKKKKSTSKTAVLQVGRAALYLKGRKEGECLGLMPRDATQCRLWVGSSSGSSHQAEASNPSIMLFQIIEDWKISAYHDSAEAVLGLSFFYMFFAFLKNCLFSPQ